MKSSGRTRSDNFINKYNKTFILMASCTEIKAIITTRTGSVPVKKIKLEHILTNQNG